MFRCQYTLTSNNQLWGCLNPNCLVLFSAVDVVTKHSSVKKTTMNAGSRFPKAFVSSAGILHLPITSSPVDNFSDRALWCQPTGINYNMHGWILCRYCATGWFWWISGLRDVTMWSSSSFTKIFWHHYSLLSTRVLNDVIWLLYTRRLALMVYFPIRPHFVIPFRTYVQCS